MRFRAFSKILRGPERTCTGRAIKSLEHKFSKARLLYNKLGFIPLFIVALANALAQ